VGNDRRETDDDGRPPFRELAPRSSASSRPVEFRLVDVPRRSDGGQEREVDFRFRRKSFGGRVGRFDRCFRSCSTDAGEKNRFPSSAPLGE